VEVAAGFAEFWGLIIVRFDAARALHGTTLDLNLWPRTDGREA